MSDIELKCAYCGKIIYKNRGEYNRQVRKGRDPNFFFCDNHCAAKYNNKPRIKPIITKICPVCQKEFKTKSGKLEATFCSRECASKGSVNEARRAAGRYAAKLNFTPETHTVEGIQHLLKKREQWKYVCIESFLKNIGCKYEFEYVIDKYIFDLVIFDNNCIYEFDGPEHHCWSGTKIVDIDKEKVARKHGFIVRRIPVQPSQEIPKEEIEKLLFW